MLILPSWYPLEEGDVEGVLFEEQARALAERGVRVGVVYAHLFRLTRWRAWLAARLAGRRRLVRGAASGSGAGSGAASGSGAGSEAASGSGAESGAAFPVVRSEGMSWLPMFPGLNRWILVRRGMHLFKKYVAAYGMPDVIHVQAMYRAGAVALALRRRYGVPYVITEHHSMYALGKLSAGTVRHYARVAAGAAARLAVSPSLCERLEELLGGAGGGDGSGAADRRDGSGAARGWFPIPNSVSARFLEYPLAGEAGAEKGRAEPGAAGQKGREGFEFLSVTHLQENKGVDVLVRAFARAFADEADDVAGVAATLTIAGDGPLGGRLEALARELGVAERIRFVGRLTREEVVRAMAACQVYVLPSAYETFGMVVVEALALGRPVVATACGGPEWILQPEEGVLVPVGDVAAMAEAMAQMRRDVARYDAHALRAGCRARFSDDVVAARLMEVYRGAVTGRTAAPGAAP